MELVLKGNFHYESLIPAFFTSVISSEVSKLIGVKPIEYPKLDLGKSVSYTHLGSFFIAWKLYIYEWEFQAGDVVEIKATVSYEGCTETFYQQEIFQGW